MNAQNKLSVQIKTVNRKVLRQIQLSQNLVLMQRLFHKSRNRLRIIKTKKLS